MSDPIAYLWIFVGVVVAVVLPVLWAYISKEFAVLEGFRARAAFPPWLKRYILLFVFSAIVALASFAIWRSANPTGQLSWFTAFLVGFGWESALEKFLRPTVGQLTERTAQKAA